MTDLIKCNPYNTKVVDAHEGRAFNLFDNKGREIGARASITFEQCKPYVEGKDRGYFTRPALETYRLDVQATRGGKDFGPSFNVTFHLTLEAARAARETYFKNAAKRAVKIAVK